MNKYRYTNVVSFCCFQIIVFWWLYEIYCYILQYRKKMDWVATLFNNSNSFNLSIQSTLSNNSNSFKYSILQSIIRTLSNSTLLAFDDHPTSWMVSVDSVRCAYQNLVTSRQIGQIWRPFHACITKFVIIQSAIRSHIFIAIIVPSVKSFCICFRNWCMKFLQILK